MTRTGRKAEEVATQIDELVEPEFSSEPMEEKPAARQLGIDFANLPTPAERAQFKPAQAMPALLAGIGGPLPATSAVMQEYGDIFDDIDDIEQKGSKYKRMKLGQGQSKEVAIDQTARAGDWIVDGFDGMKAVTVMPFSYAKQWQYWRKPETDPDEDVDPRELRDVLSCISQVRLMKKVEPELVGVGDPGGPCAQCPMSKWTPGSGGKNKPPKCTEIHILYAISLEHECRVEIPFKSTSAKIALDMLTTIRTRGWGSVLFQMGQESAKNRNGQPYWIAKYKVVDATPEMLAKGALIARREMESMGY